LLDHLMAERVLNASGIVTGISKGKAATRACCHCPAASPGETTRFIENHYRRPTIHAIRNPTVARSNAAQWEAHIRRRNHKRSDGAVAILRSPASAIGAVATWSSSAPLAGLRPGYVYSRWPSQKVFRKYDKIPALNAI
jgi:hypothetical protein